MSVGELQDPKTKQPIKWSDVKVGNVAIIQAPPAVCHRIAAGHFSHLFAHSNTANSSTTLEK